MRKNRNDRRRTRLEKETVRKLDQVTLQPDELVHAAGGGFKQTCPCPTHPTCTV